MKRFAFAAAVTLLAATALAACGTTAPDTPEAARSGEPMLFFSSRSPHSIAHCLTEHLSHIDNHAGPGYTELGVGRSAKGYAWRVTLTPSGSGSNVRVEKAVEDDSVSEPELRFTIARCTT